MRGSQPLTTVQIFSSLSIITLVTSPAEKLLALLPQIAAAMGCFGRIQDYLLSKSRVDNRIVLSNKCLKAPKSRREHETEETESPTQFSSSLQSDMVRFDNATIHPTHDAETVVIIEANLTIPKASLTILVGPVGSGKTTLLKAMLGEIGCRTGSVSVRSTSISYCSQASFILNDTVKKNICGPCDLDIDEDWYQAVIKACDLMVDVERWSEKGNTVVGSKGLKLSGGQRQRLVCRDATFCVINADGLNAGVGPCHLRTTRCCFAG